MASPTMVVRRCPTCISLAMLGEEYSTTTVCGRATGSSPSRGSSSMREASSAIHSLAQPEVDEARPADLGWLAHVGHVEPAGQFGRHLAWRAAQPLAERERHVGLEVRERGRPDHRVGVAEVRAERRHDGGVHPLCENLLRIDHVSSVSAMAGHG